MPCSLTNNPMPTSHLINREDFEKLLHPILDVAYRVAFQLTRHKDDAMDLLQDAIIQAFRGYSTFQPGSNFKAWFLRILTNRYLKIRSKKKVETTQLDEVTDVFLFQKSSEHGLLGNQDDPARIVLDGLDLEIIQKAMDELPEEFRLVCVMYFLNDFGYEQIAEVLEIPVGTVRSRLHRGRKALQRILWDLAVERGVVAGVTHE